MDEPMSNPDLARADERERVVLSSGLAQDDRNRLRRRGARDREPTLIARADGNDPGLRTRARVEGTEMVELLGRYSNPDIVSDLQRVLAGRGGDRASARTVRSVRQKQRRLDADEASDVVARYRAGESATHLPVHSTFIAPRSFG